MRKINLFVIISIFISSTYAYEVDNFTNRKQLENLPDSLMYLNAKTNNLLEKAMVKANADEKCQVNYTLNEENRPKIFDHVKEALNREPVAFMEEWVANNKNIDQVEVENHIHNIPNPKGFLEHLHNSIGIEPSIKLSDVVMGVDKIGHFLSEGYDYFEIYHLKGKPFSEAHNHVIELEKGYYGLKTTNVYSYADIASSISGLYFWENLISGDRPYFRCVNGQYQKNRLFDWSEYVNDSWDEGINCNLYSGQKKDYVPEYLKKLKLNCPITKEKCEILSELNCEAFFVSPECRQYYLEKKNNCVLKEQNLVVQYISDSNAYCPYDKEADMFDSFSEKIHDFKTEIQVVLGTLFED